VYPLGGCRTRSCDASKDPTKGLSLMHASCIRAEAESMSRYSGLLSGTATKRGVMRHVVGAGILKPDRTRTPFGGSHALFPIRRSPARPPWGRRRYSPIEALANSPHPIGAG